MNRLLIAMYRLDAARRRGVLGSTNVSRVALWIEPRLAQQYGEADCRRAFTGAESWAKLTAIAYTLPNTARLAANDGVVHMVLEEGNSIRESVGAVGEPTVITCCLPPKGTLDHSLCIEAAHHDHELQGYNHWVATGDVSFSRHILWHLSAVQCRRHFPLYSLPTIQSLRARTGQPVEALDIGCGMLSRLRWGQVQGEITLTGLDPLLNIYRVILARHGLLSIPHIAPDVCISSRAEDLAMPEHRGRYGLIFASNSLDHTQDPVQVVTQVAELLAEDGIAIIQGGVREGTREAWNQLHQYDIFVDGDTLACETKGGARTTLVGPGAPLRMDLVQFLSAEYLCIVAKLSRRV